MNIEACYYLGYSSKVHGKQGAITIKLDVDFPEEYKNLESVFIRLNEKDKMLVPFFIDHTELLTNGNLKIELEDINSAEEAKRLVGKELYLPLNTLPQLSGTKFYYHEVVGFEVMDHEKGNIGTIKRVLDYPIQSIFEIIHPNQKEILIPITDEVITKVDRATKTIEVTTPEGLIDLYLE